MLIICHEHEAEMYIVCKKNNSVSNKSPINSHLECKFLEYVQYVTMNTKQQFTFCVDVAHKGLMSVFFVSNCQ